MSRTVYYAAVSLDGFIATPDGGVAWLEPFNSPDLGYEQFLAGVGAVVMGRATYEQALTFGPWPYPGRRGLVVTSRRLSALPPGVRAVAVAELPRALRDLRASVDNDTWIVGGGQTAAACLAAGLIDELELYLVPQLLGDGIPLLARQPSGLTLQQARAFPSGVVMLRYAVTRT
jgi:dihydrofolate reductase